MSKSVARFTAVLFIAAGAASISGPAVAASTALVDEAAVVEVQAKTTYQPAIWDWKN
ncbi:hypothetical protein [Arthrobacter sp. H14]|uniref:hypothetical protein n=1 Tax=Arthrobacter sp. H14 TaxID=1312959 RepID=UPI0004B1D1B4|nr:hypothetical protein [Arthrobacter sp. H14]